MNTIRRKVIRDYKWMTPELFWGRTERSNGCWLWTGDSSKGYGRVGYDGQIWAAHRLAWFLTNGHIPDGLLVCHSCDVNYAPGELTYRRCIRPDHLWLGDCAANLQDMAKKHRCALQLRHARGEHVNTAKLFPEQVLTIRKRHAAGEAIRALSNEYELAYQSIRAIVLRQHWKHLP